MGKRGQRNLRTIGLVNHQRRRIERGANLVLGWHRGDSLLARYNRVLWKLQLVLESGDFLGNIFGCLLLRFWLCHGRAPWSWRYCWLSLGLRLWLRLHWLSGLRLVHGIGRYRRLHRLCDFLIRRKAPTLLEQAAKDTWLHRFGVGRDKHDAVPTAHVKIAPQWGRISQRRSRLQMWMAHYGLLPFWWRACHRYGCGCRYV